MLGGDINLSVTMTFFSSVAAFAMTSFWIWILGSPLVSQDLPIPYIQLAIALVSFALPVLIGIVARKVNTVLMCFRLGYTCVNVFYVSIK